MPTIVWAAEVEDRVDLVLADGAAHERRSPRVAADAP